MKIFFITGHRKSGTSLLNKLFDNHEELNVYPTDISILYAFFPQFSERYNKNTKKYNQRLKRVIYKTLLESGISFGSHSNSSKYGKIIYNHMKKIPVEDRNNPRKLVDRLCKGFLEAKRKHGEAIQKTTLLKETSILSFSPSLLKKNSKVVVLIRDPRDNFAAINAGVKKYYSKFGEDELSALASTINRIKFDLSLAAYYRKIKDKRFLFIKFEHLVTEPKKIVKKICKFCGISFNNNLLIPTVGGKQAIGNNFDGKRFSGISQSHIGQYKKRVPTLYIKIIEWFLEKEMKQWGYVRKNFYLGHKYLKAIEIFYKEYNSKYFFKDSFK
ncbi:MAG: sulfotransferase [Spirochaetia bacterium]|nr:sulfotransferase [Spirochaetia bacterium]